MLSLLRIKERDTNSQCHPNSSLWNAREFRRAIHAWGHLETKWPHLPSTPTSRQESVTVEQGLPSHVWQCLMVNSIFLLNDRCADCPAVR